MTFHPVPLLHFKDASLWVTAVVEAGLWEERVGSDISATDKRRPADARGLSGLAKLSPPLSPDDPMASGFPSFVEPMAPEAVTHNGSAHGGPRPLLCVTGAWDSLSFL